MTNAQHEDIAEIAIERAGFEVYLPAYRKRLIGVRIDNGGRRVRTRHLGAIVRRPLFPGYLFVLDPATRSGGYCKPPASRGCCATRRTRRQRTAEPTRGRVRQ